MVNGGLQRCLLVGVGLLLVGCGEGGDLGGVGESCTKTADCESGLKCVRFVCQQAGYDCPGDKNCSGLECGPDSVCGESCGSCDSAETCQAGQCVGRADEDAYLPVTGDTWTDPTSGLTWQVTPTGGPMNWSSAKTHCQSLTLAGGGWRLPTIGELRSLIRGCAATELGGTCNVQEGDCLARGCRQSSCSGCSPNQGPSGGCYWPSEMQGTCYWYWSSSPVEGPGPTAWHVDFNDGYIDLDGVDLVNLLVRCVR